MAKNRIVNTRFWIDDYISNLDPVEKLLFLYFLTNPATDISGAYEIPIKTIAVDTGLEKETVVRLLKRFSRDKKIFYLNGWVGVVNFAKHQVHNQKVDQGIKNGLSKAPKEIRDRLSIELNTLSDTNTNTNTDTNTNPNIQGVDKKEIKKLKDNLFERLIVLKGWDKKPRKEINAVYPRYVLVLGQILDLAENNLEFADDRMTRVATWAKNNNLDWSPETVIKKWLDIDDLAQEKKKKAYVDNDRAYQKGDEWWVILPNGEHKKYIGGLNKIRYE